MNIRIFLTTLIGLLAGLLSGAAQTNSPAAEAASPDGDAITTNGVPQPGAVIPLIVMDEVQLSDAIRNLARQAGLNFMLDPRISFSQTGPDGKPAPQAAVSIRWENVTAEQALTALLNNYNLQLTEDPRSKIARITVHDPAAPDPLVTRIIRLNYASPTNVAASIQAIIDKQRGKVVPDIRTSQLVVLATEKEMLAVDELVTHLDTQTRQVLIEARLVETSLNPKSSKGIDWSGTLAAQHVSYGNGVAVGKTTTSIPGTPTTKTLPSGRTITTTPSSTASTIIDTISGNGAGISFNSLSGLTPNIGFLNADGVSAVLSFLNTDASAKVLSEPRTVTLDNEQATLSVTRAVPIMNVTAGTANTTGGSQVTYTNLGVILHVTPRISANNFVNLKVMPEVSRVFDTVTKTVNGVTSQADEYDFRKIETHVMIPSAKTLVLGGLMQDDITTQSTKVPGLGDIPGLGVLFRSNAKSRQKNNLLIFITPTIVQDSDFQPTQTSFLKTHPPQTLGPDWSAWDTTEPYHPKTEQPVYDDSLPPRTYQPTTTVNP
jgi:type II secretory pathway component GspD/PulD (secretin)